MPKEINISIPLSTIWKPETEGESVRGFYQDKTEFSASKYDSSVYLIGYDGGLCCAVNSSAVLERAFDRIPIGAFVQITFEGFKNGSKYQYRSYDVKAWNLDEDEREEWNAKVSIPEDTQGSEKPASKPENENNDDLPF